MMPESTILPRFGGPEWLTAGWQFNAISTLASGNPFSKSRAMS
jgi:hypothetical protein